MIKHRTTSFITTPTLHREIKAYAKKNKISLGETIRVLIRAALSKKARK